MNGDNPSGADNQQGRSLRILTPDYVAGFVDGEGCFSVSIRPHPSIENPKRWLISPVFQVYQLDSNSEILAMLQQFFGCGSITHKGPNSKVMTFSVHSKRDLESAIIPFFERFPLVSNKHHDFLVFREAVLAMRQRLHRTDGGFRWIVERAFTMNHRGKQRKYKLEDVLAKPSETACHAPAQLSR